MIGAKAQPTASIPFLLLHADCADQVIFVMLISFSFIIIGMTNQRITFFPICILAYNHLPVNKKHIIISFKHFSSAFAYSRKLININVKSPPICGLSIHSRGLNHINPYDPISSFPVCNVANTLFFRGLLRKFRLFCFGLHEKCTQKSRLQCHQTLSHFFALNLTNQ